MAAIIFLVIFIAQAIAEKRILLNDPDLLQSQIHGLERKVEDVVAKNNDLFTKYNDQSNKYNDLATKYTDLSAKYNTLLTKTNGLHCICSQHKDLREREKGGGSFRPADEMNKK